MRGVPQASRLRTVIPSIQICRTSHRHEPGLQSYGGGRSMPDLNFRVEGAEVISYAVTPSLAFKLQIENRADESIRSIMLKTQVQIIPNLRHYNGQEQERLFELYGP